MSQINGIAIIGHFGGNEEILDGQTVKTKILYNELQNATDWKIKKVDTYYKSKKPLKLLWDTIKCVLTTKHIIILLSRNGMRFYFPLLSLCSKLFGTRVYHDLIGGSLDKLVLQYPDFRKYLNNFEVNWVESAGLKQRLQKVGVTNCEVMPNFKRLNVLTQYCEEYAEPFRFCIFSRVMKEKGVETAIEAVEAINKSFGREVCMLDIYGRIDDGYKNRFEELLKTVSSAVNYKGMVPYDKSVEAIKDYYALLFPTYWDGEGFPGTIVDAFSAGLPVIATDWNCNAEIVDDMVNGIIYPNEDIKDLRSAIEWCISHKKEVINWKESCLEKAMEYQPDNYIKQIIRTIKE